MKKYFILFLIALSLFAQQEEAVPAQPEAVENIQQTAQDADIQPTYENLQETQTADVEIPFEINNEADLVETDDLDGKKMQKIFFAGIQTGEAPEIRTRFEEMIRTRLGRESNIEFVPKEVSARICRKLFLDKKIVVNSVFFDELGKYDLQNTIVLLVDIEEYTIAKSRRFLIGAGVEGKLKANYLFYDASTKKELFFAKASSVYVVKKGLIWWNSLETRINISSSDIKEINENLLNDVVGQGFDMLEIAISFKK